MTKEERQKEKAKKRSKAVSGGAQESAKRVLRIESRRTVARELFAWAETFEGRLIRVLAAQTKILALRKKEQDELRSSTEQLAKTTRCAIDELVDAVNDLRCDLDTAEIRIRRLVVLVGFELAALAFLAGWALLHVLS